MNTELELTKSNRLKIANVFRAVKRVDTSIDCVIEGQMGKVIVDDLITPSVFCIRVGPFFYYAGEADNTNGRKLMQQFPEYHLLMPSAKGWLELAQEIFNEDLKSFPRYSFSPETLSEDHLTSILRHSPFMESTLPLNQSLVQQAVELPDSYLDLSDFDSIPDFLERGFGYTILDNGKMMGIAYTSLVCSRGIEVSVFIDEPYRKQGAATAMCCRLLLESLSKGLVPNWDAANEESVKLAEKLGYRYLDSYDCYYYANRSST